MHPVACSRPGSVEGGIFQRFRRIRESPLLTNQSRNYIQANTNIPSENHGETVPERCMDLMNEVEAELNGIQEECRRALGAAKYLVTSAVFPRYKLQGESMLTIFNLLCGRNWRSREKQLSRYIDGVCKRWGDVGLNSRRRMNLLQSVAYSSRFPLKDQRGID